MSSQGRTVINVVEDTGLHSIMGATSQTMAREQALRDAAILQAIKDVLKSKLDPAHVNPFPDALARNEAVKRVLREEIAHQRQHGRILGRVPSDDETLMALFAATYGWGPAQRYLDDPRVNEIKLVGRRIRVQEAGKPFVTVPETFDSERDVTDRARLLASLLGTKLDAEHPQVTLPVDNGTRMHITIAPRTADDGVLVCIRRGRREAWDLSDILERQSMDEAVADLLRLLCRARCSFLIAGRTNGGKTGLLEALANSWPGDPHIVTIEDNVREIGIRRTDLWTREVVDTVNHPNDFGRVAREALRQTPDLLLPGEIRGNEAGAVLRMVLSDHAVMTTLHARSCAEALEQFASYAAEPGAYMYEGRRDDALRDACAGFDVVVKVDFWEDVGRRLITEVALVNGSCIEDGAVQPLVVTLAKIDVQADGAICWQTSAEIVDGGMLQWRDGVDQTPGTLRDKLVRARALATIRAASTTLDLVQDALSRADRLLLQGEARRALATLGLAWKQRRDVRLLNQAQRALSLDSIHLSKLQHAAQDDVARLHQLIHHRQWAEAHTCYEQFMANLQQAAASAPVGGWEPIEAVIRDGVMLYKHAESACAEAEQALKQEHPHVAINVLREFRVPDLSTEQALRLVTLRERAHADLLLRGEGAPEMLASVRAQRDALQQRLQHAPMEQRS
ncbi:MAG: Flp pilus assembly complex ATPase component TadA [Chloroflexota bacterium]|nr:Flp pilus assembly complex ATPase component TadA [Chloroflexota bacterium]